MIWDFFNERHKVRAGAEATCKFILGAMCPIERADLDFDVSAEGYYKSSTATFPVDVQNMHAGYYKTLAEKLSTARALARDERRAVDYFM
jgi:mitochondrial import inner membrane translocase subunit TIM54